ncbi:translesion error-prone DNA polymerase V autoproteolytic subunit [Denitromonas sp.]|uniref:LexA family protein n=1 Tax=Denitromonas sp. TaxID=2734609 RepID=UPI002AFFBA6D|nr:translesion error-prone DNA polymerase V autoproteolytic subunit [Denitromonas sp.]
MKSNSAAQSALPVSPSANAGTPSMVVPLRTGRRASVPEDYPEVRLPAQGAAVVAIPLSAAKVSAGFPSPAADYEDKRLDINDYLVRNAVSTFFFPVQGDSMQGAEIFDGDILVVDKSVEPQHGHIVVAFVDGERLVKRLHKRGGRVALVAENPAFPAIEVSGEMEMVVWGVVVGKFKRLL